MNHKNLFHKPACRLPTAVRLGVVAVAACFIAAPALSCTVGSNATVVNGTACFDQAGKLLTITNSNGAIIDWTKFSIKAGETTHFAQTSASSTVLNRVLAGGGLSEIYGTLSSNGRVWLVNPAGIMVGAGGRVDVAGFVASTLNITNANFLAGRNVFINDGSATDVINRGEITTPAGGSVYLIGSNVSNEGIITTPGGETILAAGNTVSLIDSATPGVKVDITGAAGNATNLGEITAEAGRIGIAGVIVRNSGTLNASSVVAEGGRIFLKASQDAYVDGNGRIVTTGTKGGSVEVLGNRVAVMDNAQIDASGTNGGGSIKVGGDYQGSNPDIQNASITYFGPNASLKADATQVGDGGRVIVWADDTTRAYGTISARGGANGGNGGFVETSGKRYLDFDAKVDTRAPKGNAGTLLLDPDDMWITDAAGSDTNITYGGTYFTSSAASMSILRWSQIASALASNSINVYTSYGGNISFQQSTPWSYASSNGLTFTTSGMIQGNWGGSSGVQPSTGLMLTNTSTGSITFYGGMGVFLGNGSIKTGGSGSIYSANGSVGLGYFEALVGMSVNAKYSIWDDNWQTPGAVNIYSNGYINLYSAYGADPFSTCTGSGWCSAIQVDTAGSPTSITATVGSYATSGGIGIRHQGNLPSNVSLLDYSTNPYHNEVSLRASGDINLGSGHTLRSNGGGIHVDAGGNITVGGANFYGGPSELTFFAGGNVTVNQSLTAYGAGSFLGLAAGSTITVNNSLVSGGDIGMIAGVNKASLETIDDNQTIGNSLANQFVALLSNSGTININANVSAADFVAIVANTVNVTGATVTGTAGAAVIGAFQDLTLSAATVQGPDVFLFAGGDIRVNNGSLVYATSDSVYLGLLGSDSTLYINDTAGMYASKIHAYSPSTIHLGFLSRTTGGVVIDGLETATTVAGGSGFYVGATPVPATAGSGLQLAYANTVVTDICATSPDLCNTKPPADTPIDEAPLSFDIVGPGGTKPVDPSNVVGGTEGSFGGEEGGNDEKKDDKKDDKDKKSDQAKDEKKDEKSASKKVAQCS